MKNMEKQNVNLVVNKSGKNMKKNHLEKQNVNLVVNKLGKNMKKNHLQHTIHVRNNIILRNRYPYPHPEEFHFVHKDDFKDFVQHMTSGTKVNHSKPLVENTRLQKNRPQSLSIVRPQVPVQVPAWAPVAPPLSIMRPHVPVQVPSLAPIAPPLASKNALPTYPLQPDSEPSFAENSQTSVVESSTSAFLRNFKDSMMEFGNSSGNQLNPLACQTQVVNNIEPYQLSSSLSLGPVLPMIATNQNLPMNNGNQSMNDFSSPQTNGPQSPSSEFSIPWPTSNMNLVSPQSPYSPLLSPSLFSPPSPEFPFQPYLQNNGISSSYPGSPVSTENFPF
ncbi:protein HAIKU1-like [Trifolium pratense]|uniref:protein HAIKU1-like n=1 Tax=Trifolium pratense TaxID=57577 RepID=UPI001E697C60|nr:protein HAIKU1-like [Trifolium pratense]